MIFLIKILLQEEHINSYQTRVTLSLFYILKQVNSVNDSILVKSSGLFRQKLFRRRVRFTWYEK